MHCPCRLSFLALLALPGKLAVAIYIDNEIIEWRMIFHILMVLTK